MAKNKKILVALAILFLASLLSANLSASPMHHLDASDCTVQVACGSCLVSASIDSTAINPAPSFCGEPVETVSLFESCRSIPATPPPKN